MRLSSVLASTSWFSADTMSMERTPLGERSRFSSLRLRSGSRRASRNATSRRRLSVSMTSSLATSLMNSARSRVACSLRSMKLPRSTTETTQTMTVASSTDPNVTLFWSVMNSPDGEEQFAGGLTGFQIAVRSGGIGQRIGAIDAQAELAGVDRAEDFTGAPEEFLARQQVMAEAGAGEEQGALAIENGRVEGRYGAAGLAEEGERATRAQRVEAFLKRGLTDGIVDHVDAAATGEASGLDVELLLGVEDDFVGAGCARELGLLRGGNGAEDAGADVLGHLHRQSAGAARGGMHEAGVAGFQRKRGVGEIVSGHALKHGGGRCVENDVRGDFHQLGGRHDGVLGVRTASHGIGYTVAGRDFGDALADRFHGAGGFAAGGDWQGGFCQAGTEKGVGGV